MTDLHYDKTRLFWTLIGGLVLSAICAWLAVSHPAPLHGGRYAALYDLLGPTGVELLFGFGAIFFTLSCVVMAVNLAGDGVAARITHDGLVVGDLWGTRTIAWRDWRGFEEKTVRVRRREMRWLVIHHTPRKVGPLTRGKTALMHDHLLGDERDIDAWVEAAQAQALTPHEVPASPWEAPMAPTRGFGRRGLT